MDRKATEAITAKITGRTRVRRLTASISIVALVVLLFLLGWLLLGRFLYDGSEWYSNTDRRPVVLTAVNVGTNITAVVYADGQSPVSTYGNLWNETEVAFLDMHGHFINPPTHLTGPVIGYRSGNPDGAISVVHGMTDGIAIVFLMTGNTLPLSQAMQCLRVNASTGSISPSVEPMPGLKMSNREFQSVQWGDALHLLVWRHITNEQNYTGDVLYARSLDGGRTWQSVIVLMDGNVSVGQTCLAARGDYVSVLLLGVRDPVQGWNGSVNLLIQSNNGGTSFGLPINLTGDEMPRAIDHVDIGRGMDGTILLKTHARTDWDYGSYIFFIPPTGVVKHVIPPSLTQGASLMLLDDDEYPYYYYGDAYIVYTYNFTENSARFDTYSIGGTLRGTKTMSSSGSHGWIQPMHFTGTWNGSRIGVTTRDMVVCHGDDLTTATELLLFAEDNTTGERRVIGKPYEVVHQHTDAEDAAYAERTSHLITATWVALLVLLPTGLLATRLTRRATPKADMVRWVKLLLALIVVLMPVCFAAAIYVDTHIDYWHTHPNLFGLMYVVAGVLMVEMHARVNWKAPSSRALHIPFALLGALLVFVYAIRGHFDDDPYLMIIVPLAIVVWPVLVVLSAIIPGRFIAEMAPGEHPSFCISLRMCLAFVTIVSLILPLLMAMGSSGGFE